MRELIFCSVRFVLENSEKSPQFSQHEWLVLLEGFLCNLFFLTRTHLLVCTIRSKGKVGFEPVAFLVPEKMVDRWAFRQLRTPRTAASKIVFNSLWVLIAELI
jgi:hypothetical protein